MKKYKVSMRAVITQDVIVLGNDSKDALEKSMYGNDGFVVEAINDVFVVGICIASGNPIFENDEYTIDFDGNHILLSEIPEDFKEAKIEF